LPALLGLSTASAFADPAMPLSAGPDHIAKSVRTLRDLRDESVVKQKFDYSCGAAALATLLNYYFSDSIPEKQLLAEMLNTLSPADRADRIARGFTLLDLKNAACRHGYQAEGAVLPLTSLPQLSGPVIVYLEQDGSRHFAVLRGIREDRVYLADPNRGNLRLDIRRFARVWPGIILALGREGVTPGPNNPLALRSTGLARPELLTARSALAHFP
jgi:uncharacterized protein